MFIFPLIAALVSVVFSALLFRQYAVKGRPYQLAWSVALLMFGVASFAETIGVLNGWTEPLAKVWYLFGGTLVVGYLALGSLYISDATVASRLVLLGVVLAATAVMPLIIFTDEAQASEKITAGIVFGVLYLFLIGAAILAKEQIAPIWLMILLSGSVAAVIMLLGAPVDGRVVATQGWEAIQRSLLIRGTAVTINTFGGFILIGAAIYSGWSLIKIKTMRERAIGTILIGIGAMLPSLGGYIHGYFRAGGPAVLSISLTVGVTIMFIGFLQTGRASSPPKPTDAQAEANASA